MSNSLKDFFKENREAFDHRTAPDKVWTRIEQSLQPRPGFWHSVVVWRAAAVVFMALSIFLYFTGNSAMTRKSEMASIQNEFTDVESFYKEQIAEKVALIEDFENSYEDDHFTQDLQKLDAMYQVLREDMKSKPSEKVKDALVLNMLVRIDLLNQQIKKLEELRKPQKEQKVSI